MKKDKSQKDLYFLVAGFTIRIDFGPSESIFPRKYWREKLLNKYRNWVTEDKRKHDAELRFTQQNLYVGNTDKVNFVRLFEWKKPLVIETYYYISHTQLLYLLQVLIKRLLQKKGGFIIHASSNQVQKNKAYIFMGKSTAGKTTISNLLNNNFPKLTDDSCVVKQGPDAWYLYQIPVDSIVSIQKTLPQKFEVAAFFFLKQARKNNIFPVNSTHDLALNFIPSIWVDNKKEIPSLLKRLSIFLNSQTRFYLLEFTKEEETLVRFFKKLHI